CSYNYLGLANHPDVISAARDALAKYGLGACGSPLLSGMTDLHRQLERRVAGFLRREDAMLFHSGFGGALGTLSGLLRKTDVEHPSILESKFESRLYMERFRKHSPPSAVSSPVQSKHWITCGTMHTLTLIHVPFRRLSWPQP